MGRTIAYADGTQALEAYFAPPQNRTRAPGVLIAPTWLGITESIHQRAEPNCSNGICCFGAGCLWSWSASCTPTQTPSCGASFYERSPHVPKALKSGFRGVTAATGVRVKPDRCDWILLWRMRCPRTGTKWCAFAGCSQLSWRIGLANTCATRSNPGKNSRATWRCRSGCAL